MRGDLFINDKDAYTEWGLSLNPDGVSTLMTPAPNKDIVSNKSRLQHGKRVINDNPRKDERNLTLVINIRASSVEEFLSRYESFCNELATGELVISTRYQPGVKYYMNYLSCSQFAEYHMGLGKFTLRLNEPNPSKRT